MSGGNRVVLAGSIRARRGALAMQAGDRPRPSPVTRARGAAFTLGLNTKARMMRAQAGLPLQAEPAGVLW